jgi:hypothetical protein
MQKYSQEKREHVRLLRQSGWSLGKIQKEMGIPKTTIQSWISDIVISEELQKVIKKTALLALQEGRIKAQGINKEKKVENEKKNLEKGIERIGTLSDKELFIAGVALYWGEGFKNKHEHRLGFCNSDPHMVKFYLNWLEKCLAVEKKDLVARLTVNRIYENQIEKLENYWSQATAIPLSQFTKPFYQNTKWKKQYNQDNYHGVLRIHVKGSLDHLLEMKGWLEGLKRNTPG